MCISQHMLTHNLTLFTTCRQHSQSFENEGIANSESNRFQHQNLASLLPLAPLSFRSHVPYTENNLRCYRTGRRGLPLAGGMQGFLRPSRA